MVSGCLRRSVFCVVGLVRGFSGKSLKGSVSVEKSEVSF